LIEPQSAKHIFVLIASYSRLYFHCDKSTDLNTRHSYTAHFAGLIRGEITEVSVWYKYVDDIRQDIIFNIDLNHTRYKSAHLISGHSMAFALVEFDFTYLKAMMSKALHDS
jgi:hypothetical protein